jgi:hypothetical protein
LIRHVLSLDLGRTSVGISSLLSAQQTLKGSLKNLVSRNFAVIPFDFSFSTVLQSNQIISLSPIPHLYLILSLGCSENAKSFWVCYFFLQLALFLKQLNIFKSHFYYFELFVAHI